MLFFLFNPRLQTPRRRWHYLAIGLGVIASWWAGSIHGLTTDLDRLVFPTCADSIGIPMAGMTFGAVVLGALALMVGYAVSRSFGDLPVEIFARHDRQSRGAKELGVVFGIVGLLILVMTVSAALTADWLTVPAGIVAIYLVAATLAGCLAAKSPRL